MRCECYATPQSLEQKSLISAVKMVERRQVLMFLVGKKKGGMNQSPLKRISFSPDAARVADV